MNTTVMPRSLALRQSIGKTNIEQQNSFHLVTIAETCEILRVSKWSVYALLRKRKLESIEIGRRRLIPAASIKRLVEQQLEAAKENGPSMKISI
jgi:excisionase family DNA binding protein